MDFANRGNRPGQQSRPADSATQSSNDRSFEPPKNNKKPVMGMDFAKIGGMAMLVITSLLIIAVVAALIFVKKDTRPETDLINTDKYQAVFLNSQDGQVYFGKLGVYNQDLYSLTDIYYVRVNQQVQPGSETPEQNISLAKLGAELHCPVDQMFIARDQVLYWENIQDKGQVVTAIKDYQESGETVECGSTDAADQQQQQTQDAAGTAPEGSDAGSDTDGTNPPTEE